MRWRRKTFRRRRYRRRYRRYKKRYSKITRQSWYSKYADSCKFRLKYVYYTGTTSATSQLIQFRGNSLYDPNVAVGGDQPAGFDDLTAAFTKFLVLGSAIKISLMPDSNVSTLQTFTVVLYPVTANNSSTWSSLQLFKQLDTIPMIRYRDSFTNSTGKPIRLKHYCGTRKIFSLNNSNLFYGQTSTGGDVYWHPINNNPTAQAQWYWNVGIYSPDGIQQTTPMLLKVEIIYYGLARDRQIQNDT